MHYIKKEISRYRYHYFSSLFFFFLCSTDQLTIWLEDWYENSIFSNCQKFHCFLYNSSHMSGQEGSWNLKETKKLLQRVVTFKLRQPLTNVTNPTISLLILIPINNMIKLLKSLNKRKRNKHSWISKHFICKEEKKNKTKNKEKEIEI